MRPGWKTTEFWITLTSILGLVASSVAFSLTPRYAAIGAGISGAAYAISRGLAKMFPPNDTELP